MEKQIFLIRGLPGEPRPDFSRRAKQAASLSAQLNGVESVKIVLSEPAPPAFSVIPFSKSLLAALSIYGENLPGDLPPASSSGGVCGQYRVTEAFPVAYQKDWPDGAATPATGLLTLFRKKTGLDRDTFLDRWHNGHTPLSLRLHPLWHYSRNVVEESLEEGSEPWDGIVDEYFKKRSDLLNVYRFIGNSPLFPWHMLQVYQDVQGFLDYKSTETYLATEYVIKS